MIYIYSKNLKTGKEECVRIKDDWPEAITALANLYQHDEKSVLWRGLYYYFAKELG